MLLITVPSIIHLARPLTNQGHQGLDTVGGFKTDPQFPKESQSMKGQGFDRVSPFYTESDRRLDDRLDSTYSALSITD